MTASIQEMSSTNTQQLRVSSRRASRTRRSWQRRGLAILVVSTYLLQCATAHEEDLRRLLNKTQRSDPAHRGLLKMTAIDREAHLTDIKLEFNSDMEHECVGMSENNKDLIGTYTYTCKNPHTYMFNNKRCIFCKQPVEGTQRENKCLSCGGWKYQGLWKEDAPKAYIKRIEAFSDTTNPEFINGLLAYEENGWSADWGIFDSNDVLHFWANDDSPHGDCPPNRGWQAYENDYTHQSDKYSPPKTHIMNQNLQVAKYINITGANTYEAPSSSSSSSSESYSYERVECVHCEGSGSTWYFTDCSYCNGDGYNLE